MSLPSLSDHAPSHNNQHLSDTDAEEEEEGIQDNNSGAEKSRQVYIGSGNDKKVLYLLCIGLNHPDRNDAEPLFSFETEPWSLLPKSSIVRPKTWTTWMKSCDAQNYTTLCLYLERETGTEFRQWSGFRKIPFAITLTLNFSPMRCCELKMSWFERQGDNKKWMLVDVDTGVDLPSFDHVPNAG